MKWSWSICNKISKIQLITALWFRKQSLHQNQLSKMSYAWVCCSDTGGKLLTSIREERCFSAQVRDSLAESGRAQQITSLICCATNRMQAGAASTHLSVALTHAGYSGATDPWSGEFGCYYYWSGEISSTLNSWSLFFSRWSYSKFIEVEPKTFWGPITKKALGEHRPLLSSLFPNILLYMW